MAAKNGALTLTSDDVNYLVDRYMQESGECSMRTARSQRRTRSPCGLVAHVGSSS